MKKKTTLRRKSDGYLRLGLAITGILTALILVGCFWTPYDPNALSSGAPFTPPCLSHLFGTDHFGRDIFSRVLKGGGTTLLVAVSTVAIGGIAAMFPILWQFLGQYQRNRILILFDPTVDPQGINERYHSKINLQSLTGGGLTGQGLFNGNRTQSGALFAQHTDYIFSSMGEEIGFIGCVCIMLAELAIIARCVYVGIRCQDYMRRLVCYGAASALMFQLMINVGMCIGVMPVIGLTLPLISYGGSSVVSIYAMLGLVSGAHARPQSLSHERYVQPYR